MGNDFLTTCKLSNFVQTIEVLVVMHAIHADTDDDNDGTGDDTDDNVDDEDYYDDDGKATTKW